MPTLQVAKATAYTTSASTLRIAQAGGSGSGSSPTLRVAGSITTSNTRVNFRPFADITVEAFEVVNVVALLATGSATPDGYAWRQVSGPATIFSDNGDSIMFTAPPAMAGATVVFGVIGSIQGENSNEATIDVLVIPHVLWRAVGAEWKALTRLAKA